MLAKLIGAVNRWERVLLAASLTYSLASLFLIYCSRETCLFSLDHLYVVLRALVVVPLVAIAGIIVMKFLFREDFPLRWRMITIFVLLMLCPSYVSLREGSALSAAA